MDSSSAVTTVVDVMSDFKHAAHLPRSSINTPITALVRIMLCAGLATATIWPVAVLNCATLIDSAWDVACLRAESGGKLLANMLAARLHGDRPVMLLGVSIGARLVYYCLLELYKLGARALPLHACKMLELAVVQCRDRSSHKSFSGHALS